MAGLNQRFSTQITPRPVFRRKKIPQPSQLRTFHHLKTFHKASFTLFSTKNLNNSHAHDLFEILHDPLPGRDPSVEKRCFRSYLSNLQDLVNYRSENLDALLYCCNEAFDILRAGLVSKCAEA